MRELETVAATFPVMIETAPFGYVRKVYVDDEACWGLFDQDGDVIFVGDASIDCHSYAAKEQIRVQVIH